MSKRRKSGDVVWVSSTKIEPQLAEIQDDSGMWCNKLQCRRDQCFCWATLYVLVDGKYTDVLHHVSECELFDSLEKAQEA